MAASLATNAPPPRRDPWRLWAGDAVFLEAALGLRRALLSIGVDAAVDVGADGAAPWTQKPGHRWILVGATRAPGVAPAPAPWPWPEYYVVYQLEQLDSAWLTPRCRALRETSLQTSRGDAAAGDVDIPWSRGDDMDILWVRVAATLRLGTRIFCGVAATPRPRRG